MIKAYKVETLDDCERLKKRFKNGFKIPTIEIYNWVIKSRNKVMYWHTNQGSSNSVGWQIYQHPTSVLQDY